MNTLARETSAAQIDVAGGVDTHQDTHTAAVVDQAGRMLGHRTFPTTEAGYRQLLAWLGGFGTLRVVGVEGTGAYGAGLARYLMAQGQAVVEVDRPDRKARRAAGKSDPIDAESAARAALNRVRTGLPKQCDGMVEALRNLRIARRSAVIQRADCMRRIKTLIITAPQPLRERLRGLSDTQLPRSVLGYAPTCPWSVSPSKPRRSCCALGRRHAALSSADQFPRTAFLHTLPFRGPPRPLVRDLDTPKHPAGRRRWEREAAQLLHRIKGRIVSDKAPRLQGHRVRTSGRPQPSFASGVQRGRQGQTCVGG
jgi:hypothetical protein